MKTRDLLSASLLTMLACAWVAACDTPVYRYAMYRWEPAAYEVYHFHAGDADSAFKAVHEQLRAAQQHETSPANVAVRLVDATDDGQLQNLPREIRKLREQHAATPLTIVTNPLGIEVFQGDLDSQQTSLLLQSTAPRNELTKLLSAGHAGLFVLVPGNDADLNAAAEQSLATLVADVNSGKVELGRKPSAANPLSDANANADSAKPTIAKLTLTRESLASQDPWLLKSLMAVESDLYDFVAEPMVFVVYGRGRALPPFIGKGITPTNLVDIAEFITGACSCTVKEQNPGVDLLLAYDWQSAAAALARQVGAEEGNESFNSGDSQLIAAADATADDPPAETSADEATPEEKPTNPASAEEAETDSPDDEQPSATDVDPKVIERNEVLANIDQRYQPRAAPTTAAPVAQASPQLFLPLSLGLAVGFALLVAVMFLVLKPL